MCDDQVLPSFPLARLRVPGSGFAAREAVAEALLDVVDLIHLACLFVS